MENGFSQDFGGDWWGKAWRFWRSHKRRDSRPRILALPAKLEDSYVFFVGIQGAFMMYYFFDLAHFNIVLDIYFMNS